MPKIGEGTGPAAIAAHALRAQQARMRIIAENMANSQTTAQTPGGDPYRRQAPVFTPMRLEDGSKSVRMAGVEPDPTDFKTEYAPGHPAANAAGYVKLPNVDTLIEALDMKAAQRAYEANLNMLDAVDNMENRTLDIIKKP